MDARFQCVHGFVNFVEALNGKEQVVHLIHLDGCEKDFIEDEWPHLAAAVQYVRAFTVGTDQPAAVHLDAAILSNESELHGVPEYAPEPFQNRIVINARADLTIMCEEVSEDGMRVHGHMAEHIVKDIWLRRVFKRVAAAQPCGGGKTARRQHLEESRSRHEAADRSRIPA